MPLRTWKSRCLKSVLDVQVLLCWAVMVEYYGAPTPLAQVSNVNTPDARTISIQPWEKSIIPDIERAIMNAGLGFNPMNNGESVIISVPPLTEERRRELAKMAKAESESAKVGVRAARKSAMDELKKMGNDGLSEDMRKDSENDIQKMTDEYIAKCDAMFAKKENASWRFNPEEDIVNDPHQLVRVF